MSALFTRLAELHEAGLAREGVTIHHDPRVEEGTTFRPAAVLAAITERARPGLLLIHRPSTMRAHPGQVALPGGKIDAGESPVDAALREANEELGIHAGDVRIVGESDLYRTGSGYEITPIIGMVPSGIALEPNPSEVARWFEAPLDFVLDPANHRQHHREWNGRTIAYWEITWEDHRIWGITAGLLVNLARRWRWS